MSNSSSELIFQLRKRIEELETNLLKTQVSNRDGQRLINDLNHQLTEATRREAELQASKNVLSAWIIELEARVKTLEDAVEPYQPIIQERASQDAEWGGPEHDDKHDWSDWKGYILYQLERLKWREVAHRQSLIRERFVKIAALAIATIESIDRKQALAAKEPKA